jgi:hypothetical protein
MDRVTALHQTRRTLTRTGDQQAMYAGLLLAIDTTTAAADGDPDRTDAWDFCTLELHEAATHVAIELGDAVALSPHLPPVGQIDTQLSAALKELLTALASRYRDIRPSPSRYDGVAVASLLDGAARALP